MRKKREKKMLGKGKRWRSIVGPEDGGWFISSTKERAASESDTERALFGIKARPTHETTHHGRYSPTYPPRPNGHSQRQDKSRILKMDIFTTESTMNSLAKVLTVEGALFA